MSKIVFEQNFFLNLFFYKEEIGFLVGSVVCKAFQNVFFLTEKKMCNNIQRKLNTENLNQFFFIIVIILFILISFTLKIHCSEITFKS